MTVNLTGFNTPNIVLHKQLLLSLMLAMSALVARGALASLPEACLPSRGEAG
jgi:hypothetical protein